MGLRELKRLMDVAIDACQQIIEANPKAVLSEGDFGIILLDQNSNTFEYEKEILL
jgi:hypothetical protein